MTRYAKLQSDSHQALPVFAATVSVGVLSVQEGSCVPSTSGRRASSGVVISLSFCSLS